MKHRKTKNVTGKQIEKSDTETGRSVIIYIVACTEIGILKSYIVVCTEIGNLKSNIVVCTEIGILKSYIMVCTEI
jgi:hypothetical protein